MRDRHDQRIENTTMNRIAMNRIETMGETMAVRGGSASRRLAQGIVALVAAALAGVCLLAAASAAKAAPYGIETSSVEL
jgi:hypothetical protein